MENNVELLVPITFFIVVAVMWISFFYFRNKFRLRVQETLQTALQKGTELTPEIIDKMLTPTSYAELDFRKGIIAISIGLAVFLFAIILGEEDAIKPLMAISVFPIFVGLAYLLLWKKSNTKLSKFSDAHTVTDN